MRTKFIFIDYNNKPRKITKKEAMTLITKEQFEEAKYNFIRGSMASNEYMVRGGRLAIWFEK